MNTLRLSTGFEIRNFTAEQFVVQVRSMEVLSNIVKLVGVTPTGVEIELLTSDPAVMSAMKSSWGTKVTPGMVYQGCLPYRNWKGRKHQFYLDARGQESYYLAPHHTNPLPQSATPVVTEAVEVVEEQASTPVTQPTCKCRKTKTGACHKTDARKNHASA